MQGEEARISKVFNKPHSFYQICLHANMQTNAIRPNRSKIGLAALRRIVKSLNHRHPELPPLNRQQAIELSMHLHDGWWLDRFGPSPLAMDYFAGPTIGFRQPNSGIGTPID